MTLNQTTIISNLKTFPIYDGTFLIGHIIIIEDITEYDQLQKQVILSEKLASVGLLAAGVAHEINNPLGIIANYLSYIKYTFYDQKLHEAIDNVHEEIASIANIVSNLHTFSDNKPLTIEDLDINELIRSMLHLVQHNAKSKQITIHFEPYDHDLTISANKNEIKQVILNLLKNSFEAMPSGGEIVIKTTLLPEHEANVVQMTFQDTGPGIGDENPNNIFLPFYSTKKGQEHNLGLGLSVSYGIIKKYNGTISVRNLENAGCQFTIKIPQSPR
jgi:signal transduction histidine kinase